MMDREGYCRQLESYLCRKNDGHLIRIVGPAFETVSRWAEEGIPLTVACEGIDRYFERYYRRGPRRRRPVRIEFCEADVLDAFDAWRRAVGVARDAQDEQAGARRRESLAAHVERSIAALTALRASSQAARRFDSVLDEVARELDVLQPQAKGARGDARDAVIRRLHELHRRLVDAATASLSPEERSAVQTEAREQLAPFRERMAPDAFENALRAAAERAVRERFRLPALAFE